MPPYQRTRGLAHSDEGYYVMTQMERTSFGLPEVLEALWSDLASAEEDLRLGSYRNELAIDSASVEIAFTVTGTGRRGGGLSIQVLGIGFQAGAEKTTGSQLVHRVTLHLSGSDEPQLLVPGDAAKPRLYAGKSGKRSTARKSTARKSTARKSTARKSTARKSTARKSTARKSTARK